MSEAVKSLGIVMAGGDVPINNGTRGELDTPCFRDSSETWFSEKQVEWRQSYQSSLREVLDMHLLPRFGDQRVSRITKADILAFRAQLAKVPARGKTVTLSNSRTYLGGPWMFQLYATDKSRYVRWMPGFLVRNTIERVVKRVPPTKPR